MKKARLRSAVTLWLGMYLITCALFWYESGHLATGLKFGLASASLKTLWSVVHHHLFHKPIVIEETIRI